ncbi:hypothetical protein OPIT5_02215 [Opitutaceae bacterium TAV5]|nr:hypothetical protein OPIT5_02215 [Opitutaceae bacterium TAV5]
MSSSRHLLLRILPVLALAPILSAVAHADALLVEDPLNADSGWMLAGAPAIRFRTDPAKPSPTPSPDSYIVAWNGERKPLVRGVVKYFDDVKLQPGTWVVSFYVGHAENRPFPENIETVQLLADSNGDYKPGAWFDYTERVVNGVTVQAANTPPEKGQWTKWTCTFTVASGARTAGGRPAIGKTLGFMFMTRLPPNHGFLFDHLTVRFTPADASGTAGTP